MAFATRFSQAQGQQVRTSSAKGANFVPFRAVPAKAATPAQQLAGSSSFVGQQVYSAAPSARVASRSLVQRVQAIKDGEKLDRPLRVAVIGGGPSGACAAETLAKGGCETFMFERKLDNCKVNSA